MEKADRMGKQHNSISTLFVDIGGVLLTNGWDHNSRKLAAERFGLDAREMDERHHLTFDTYEVGKISLEDYLARVVFYRDRSFSQKDFTDFMFAQSQAIPEMIELVYRIKRDYGIEIAAVSNEGRELTMYRVEKFRLREFIDFFISSCFVHYRKPDEDIYRIALDVAQVQPDQVAYIDDRAMFVDVARGLGIHSIVHTDFQSTRQSLAELGLAVEI
ncbi:MAG: HAD family hydrolase [Anaerolineales bacterium]|jgi:putative hydrolase of the HAD superfamily